MNFGRMETLVFNFPFPSVSSSGSKSIQRCCSHCGSASPALAMATDWTFMCETYLTGTHNIVNSALSDGNTDSLALDNYSRGPAIAPPRDKPAKGALFVSGGAKSTQYFMLF